tara:strand:+ start:1539 stop:2213 length:675 start_codon:yes stop_codon:yes gene_type:complete
MVGKFTFATREEGFDQHIEQSIRGYSNLWNDVLQLSRYFVEDHTNVVDIGCSTGKLLRSMIDQNDSFAPFANYNGVEVEEDFYEGYEEDESRIVYHKQDIRDYHFKNNSFITSIFTLQFMPPKDRKTVMKRIYNGLNTGGGFVFAEKVFSDDAKVQDMITFMYYDYKRKSFTSDDILNKEIELRHMMKPDTTDMLQTRCFEVGFDCVQQFWQNHNFVGFIAIKK